MEAQSWDPLRWGRYEKAQVTGAGTLAYSQGARSQAPGVPYMLTWEGAATISLPANPLHLTCDPFHVGSPFFFIFLRQTRHVSKEIRVSTTYNRLSWNLSF